MLLRHFGLHAHADRIENAWLFTLENEMFTADCGVDKS
jgi:isocitrate/isopropylmalate dehydrogenase